MQHKEYLKIKENWTKIWFLESFTKIGHAVWTVERMQSQTQTHIHIYTQPEFDCNTIQLKKMNIKKETEMDKPDAFVKHECPLEVPEMYSRENTSVVLSWNFQNWLTPPRLKFDDYNNTQTDRTKTICHPLYRDNSIQIITCTHITYIHKCTLIQSHNNNSKWLNAKRRLT